MEKETPKNKISSYKIKKVASRLPQEEANKLFENLAKEQENIINSNKSKASLPHKLKSFSAGAAGFGLSLIGFSGGFHATGNQDADSLLAMGAACTLLSFIGYMASKHVSKINGYDKETTSKNINEANENLERIEKIKEAYNNERGM